MHTLRVYTQPQATAGDAEPPVRVDLASAPGRSNDDTAPSWIRRLLIDKKCE